MSEMNFCPADDEMRNIVSDSTFEVVDILCQHEDTTYTKRDWVAMARQEQVLIPDVLHSATKMTTGPLHYHLTLNESLSKVTADCRQDMFKWYMEMVEYVGLQQTTIEITLSILDRFLMTPSGYMARHDRRAFQLASIAAFYTAVKVHEPLALSPAMVSQLTNGLFTACDIELEEAELLEALQWRVNPPTATEFCHLLVQLLPRALQPPHPVQESSSLHHIGTTVLELALLQTELAMGDYRFISIRASTVAYAAIMNALECSGIPSDWIIEIGKTLAKPLHVIITSEHSARIQSVLYQLVAQERPTLLANMAQFDNPIKAATTTMSTTASPSAYLKETGESSPRAVLLTSTSIAKASTTNVPIQR